MVDNLKGPSLPRTKVRIDDDPSWGPSNAPVTVVEFSDYECPACREAHRTVQRLKDIYAGKIRWVFKDFPLSKHKMAEKAAEAARCAGDQGKFWEYQDILFSSKEGPDTDHLVGYARGIGLDENKFGACLNGGKHREDVIRSHNEGRDAGVGATPSFIINGMLITGAAPLDHFKQIIDDELKRN